MTNETKEILVIHADRHLKNLKLAVENNIEMFRHRHYEAYTTVIMIMNQCGYITDEQDEVLCDAALDIYLGGE